jgi:hypothetical protein
MSDDNPLPLFPAFANEFEQVRRLKLDAYKEGMPPAMDTLAKMILKHLGAMAQHDGPLMRVCDLEQHMILVGEFMQKLTLDQLECFERLFQDTIEVLKMRGDIVERDHGDPAVGITDAVLQAEKELFGWMSSTDGKVEAALAEAAKEAHPNWVKQERNVGDRTREAAEKGDRFAEMLVNTVSWKIADPLNTPISPAALVDWFEKTHPAEAKRIRPSCGANARELPALVAGEDRGGLTLQSTKKIGRCGALHHHTIRMMMLPPRPCVHLRLRILRKHFVGVEVFITGQLGNGGDQPVPTMAGPRS